MNLAVDFSVFIEPFALKVQRTVSNAMSISHSNFYSKCLTISNSIQGYRFEVDECVTASLVDFKVLSVFYR